MATPSTSSDATSASSSTAAPRKYNLRNPLPLSATQEQEVKQLYYKRVRGYCAAEIKGMFLATFIFLHSFPRQWSYIQPPDTIYELEPESIQIQIRMERTSTQLTAFIQSLRRMRRKPHHNRHVGLPLPTSRHELMHDCPRETGGRGPRARGVVCVA